MKKNFLFLIVIVVATINFSQAQFLTGSNASAILKNAETIALINDDYLPSYIKFKAGEEIDVATVATWLRDNFNLSPAFGLKFIRSEKDQIGYTHYRYQQTINGYPVQGGDYIAHVLNGQVVSLNGKMKKFIEPGTSITLNENDALQKALTFVNATVYKWQIPGEEKLIKYITGDSLATFYPKGELVIVSKKGNSSTDEYHLAYKFDIFAQSPLSRQYIFVDAATGEIIKTLNEIHTSDVTATAATKYSGTRTITTDYTGTTYRLREADRGLGIETYDMNVGTNYGSAVDFTNASTTWTGTNTYKDEVARDAHWGAEMTYDFYLTTFGRSSVDNAGLKLLSYVHSNLVGMGYTDNVNAFWDGTRMTYGDGDATYSPLTTLDICGHEITHGVTSYTANLDYQDESGAMNEGFSDIFGTCIEWYAKPPLATGNWTIGEEIGSAFRSMSSPNTYQQPDTYNGTNWYSGTQDNGGVHTNSGVLNYWFYLLCQGGSGTNDIGNAFNVTGITMTKAEQIAYRTLTYYLTSTSVYADARTYSLQACQDLYGGCGPEMQATTNAWYAVGIGASWVSAAVTANFTANTQAFCTVPATVQFTNTSSNATTYLWNFGDGSTSTTASPSHVYSNAGTFNVKLVAYGGSCGNDSLLQNSYITINLPTSPTTTGATRCNTGSVTLGASASSGSLQWYNSSSGGSIINTGTSYTTPSLTTTTTYYVQDSIPGASHTCAKPDNTGGGGYTSTGNHYLIFDCYTPVTLVSVKIYGNTTAPGNKTIALLNSAGTTLQSATVNVIAGLNTYTLNFSLPAATGLRLQCEGTNVYRNNASVAYPYTTTGFISVTSSDAGTGYYYYFYGWVIQESGCKSARVPVVATISSPATASLSIAANPTGTICGGSSVTFTATPTNGGTTPSYQWMKNGSIITGATNSTYTSTTLANNDAITCVMTTNDNCITGSPATSNSITMAVTTPLTVSVGITANPTGAICSGSSVTFTATPVNGGTTPIYQWQKNGSNITGANNSTYTSVTLINNDAITCIVTNNTGCVTGSPATSNSITMAVNSPLAANVTISANPAGSICSGTSVTFTATPANGGTLPQYQWKKNGVNVGTNSATYTSSTLANNDAITCVMTSNASCISGSPATSNSIVMAVSSSLVANISIAGNPATATCQGTNITFTATPVNGGTSPVYQWQVNGNNAGTNSSTFSSSALNNGDIVTCNMTSSASCVTGGPVSSNSWTVNIASSLPASDSISVVPGTNICSGTSVTFTATPANGGVTPSFQWKVNGINVGTNSSTYSTSTLANNDVVTCVMTSSESCAINNPSTSNPLTMHINTGIVTGVSISSSTIDSICPGASVTFTATPSNGGTSPIYQWQVNGSNVGTSSSTFTSSSLVDGDIVSCVVISSLSCVTGNPATSNLITVAVFPTITPVISLLNGDSLVSSLTDGNQWYQYYSTGSVPVPGATGQSYVATADGEYFAIVTDANGCSSDTSNIINVIINDITNYSLTDIKVYPIPTGDHIMIESDWNSSNPADFDITDILGHTLFAGNITSKIQKVNLESFAQGIYILRIRSENAVFSKRIIIER